MIINDMKRREMNIALKQSEALQSAYENDNDDFLPEKDGPASRGYSTPVSIVQDIKSYDK
jgi:hypothetical protein